MQYKKPLAVELSSHARNASGGGPRACVPGAEAGTWESCGGGGAADWTCDAGGAAGAYTSCMPGGAADANGDCLSGSVVLYYCEAGTGGGNDPYGCNVGPSFA